MSSMPELGCVSRQADVREHTAYPASLRQGYDVSVVRPIYKQAVRCERHVEDVLKQQES